MTESRVPADDRLDAMLVAWARDHSADPATLQRLQQSIAASAAAGPAALPASRTRTAGPVAAAAVCLVLAALVGWATRDAPSTMANRPPARLAVLWKETESVFGAAPRWICDLEEELLLGMDDAPRPTGQHLVGLSLTLRVFDAATGAWENSWTGQIACRGGVPVDFASADKRTSGSIWVQSRPDGRFAVSHWLNWSDHPEWSGAVDATVSSDRPQVVSESVRNGQRIQIVQQVWNLDVG